MIERIPLEQIEDNPFQVRLDYSGIAELAGSIAAMALIKADTSGLLQVPPARIVLRSADGKDHVVLNAAEYGGALSCLGDEPLAIVELAAGHRRFRAFQHLAAGGNAEYATFPVDIQVLDEKAMDAIAAAENANRDDLSVIEEALSLQRAMEHFGLSQAEVGARRGGLTQAAVSNKIRLLALPDWCQRLIHEGQLSERHGRAVLPWLQLPGFTFHAGDLKNRIKGTWMSVEELEEHVRDVINNKAQDLGKAPWSPRDTWVPDPLPEGVLGPCGGCEHNVPLLRGRRCLRKGCYQAKEKAYARQVAGPAEAARKHANYKGWRAFPPKANDYCTTCKTYHRESEQAGDWYKPLDNYFPTICGECWTRAGLPIPQETPASIPTPAQPPQGPHPAPGARPPAGCPAPHTAGRCPSPSLVQARRGHVPRLQRRLPPAPGLRRPAGEPSDGRRHRPRMAPGPLASYHVHGRRRVRLLGAAR